MTNNVFRAKQIEKNTQQQNKKANIKILVRAGKRTWDVKHRNLMRYLWTTGTSEHIDCSQFYCFHIMGGNKSKQNPICRLHFFSKVVFSVIFCHAWTTIFRSFSHLRG